MAAMMHMTFLVCSTPLLAPGIDLYMASLVSLTDILIGWCVSDCDAPTQLLRVQINMGNTAPSPMWRVSPTWRKQKAFTLRGLLHCGYFEKAGISQPFSGAMDSPMLADMGRETVYDIFKCFFFEKNVGYFYSNFSQLCSLGPMHTNSQCGRR